MSRGIAARGLSKVFSGRLAVDGVSFTAEPGEVFGLLGPNGAGKTTTVRMLTTMLAPSGGTAEVAGVAVTPQTGPELRRRIGVMPEAAGLYSKLTVADNLMFFARLYGYRGTAASKRIDRALQAVGLQPRAADLAGTLSKGLRQRAALARTLVGDPEVLFLDEPTAGLDPEATAEVRELIASLRSRGVTVFLTTHRLEEAQRLCDRVAIINTRLLTVGSPDELRTRSGAEAYTLRVAGDAGPVLDRLAAVRAAPRPDGSWRVEVADSAKGVAEMVRRLVEAGIDVHELARTDRSLEDAYLDLVREQR
ncbi:MAG: ATP-binding cassette domain-containing protein [Acidimicrobiia bacterium]